VTDSPDLRNTASPNPESKESDKKKDLTDFTDKKKEPTDSINSKKTEPTESKKKEAKPELTEDEKSKLRSLHASDKPSSELDGDEQKGVKRLGIPTTQEKLASSNPDSPKSDRLGLSETGSFANPNESIVPPHGDDQNHRRNLKNQMKISSFHLIILTSHRATCMIGVMDNRKFHIPRVIRPRLYHSRVE
jgi:hypothetical protein